MRDFRTLRVWQAAHQLTLRIYRETKSFPREELCGLTSQLRRGAASVAANIAEGCGWSAGPNRARYFQVAAGSAFELEYHLLLAGDLKLLDSPTYQVLARSVVSGKRMLAGLLRKMRAT